MTVESENKNIYDLIIIGAGPGGYAAALRAAQLGLRVAVVEKDLHPGGVCLNVGCIPSKALLDASEAYVKAKDGLDRFGIKTGSMELDWEALQSYRAKVVEENVRGIEFLFQKSGINQIRGTGFLEGKNRVGVHTHGGTTRILSSPRIVLATGSVPVELPGFPFDEKRIVSSTGLLSLKKIPDRLVIIGGGVIGLELGSVYSRLGSDVTVLEARDRILGEMDGMISRELLRILKKQGLRIETGVKVTGALPGEEAIDLSLIGSDGKEITRQADVVCVAVGRRPLSEIEGLEKTKVRKDEKGFLAVDESLETDEPGIFALGDLTAGKLLAHRAREEGVFLAERFAGQKPSLHPEWIPSVIYTWPEAAGVGKTEEKLKREKVPYRIGSFPVRALGRARASGDLEGQIKVLCEKDTDEILGIHMVAPRAADLIAEAVVALAFRAGAEDLGRIVHAHPTYSEALQEAGLSASGIGALHLPGETKH